MTSSEADYVAREIANKAIDRIEGHEKICAERQTNIINSLSAVQRGVDRINGRLWAAAVGIISMLVIACGALVFFILKTMH